MRLWDHVLHRGAMGKAQQPVLQGLYIGLIEAQGAEKRRFGFPCQR